MNKSVSGRLRLLIITAIILSTLLPVIITSSYLVYNIGKEATEKNKMFITGLSRYITNFLNNCYDINYLLSINREISDIILSANPDWTERTKEYSDLYDINLTTAIRNSGYPLLKDTQLRHPFIELLFLQDAKGNQVARSFGPIGQRADRWWFRRFNTGEHSPFVSNSYFSLTGHVPVISIFHPVTKNDKFIGILGVDINFGYIQQKVQEYIKDKNTLAIVIDNKGVIISHPDDSIIKGIFNIVSGYQEMLSNGTPSEMFFLQSGAMDADGNLPTDIIPIEIDNKIAYAASETLKGNNGIIKSVIYNERKAELHYHTIELPGKSETGKENRYGILLLHFTDTIDAYIRVVIFIITVFTLVIIFLIIGYINFQVKVLVKDIKELENKKKELLEFAYRDSLTHLYNRRFFTENSKAYFHRAVRAGGGLGVVMLDIDYFKNINDTYGHAYGDYVLKEISKILLNSIRENDIVARMGGEEFCILLESVDETTARIIAERIRQKIELFPFNYNEKETKITISIGVCIKLKPTFEKMLKKADFLLYDSKVNGRNKVTLEGDHKKK